MRRSRHWRVSAESSISAMLSQEPSLGGVVDLEPLCQREGSLGVEGLIERAGRIGIEVVHHEHDLFGVGVVDGEQALDLVGQSIRVRRGRAITRRWPASGSTQTKIEQVP